MFSSSNECLVHYTRPTHSAFCPLTLWCQFKFARPYLRWCDLNWSDCSAGSKSFPHEAPSHSSAARCALWNHQFLTQATYLAADGWEYRPMISLFLVCLVVLVFVFPSYLACSALFRILSTDFLSTWPNPSKSFLSFWTTLSRAA